MEPYIKFHSTINILTTHISYAFEERENMIFFVKFSEDGLSPPQNPLPLASSPGLESQRDLFTYL